MNFGRQYLTYDEYKQLGGTLDENAFNLLEYEARKKINVKTFNRISRLEEIPTDVKMCMYNLITTIGSYEENHNKTIASESVGSYSVTYATASSETSKTKCREISTIIETYLDGVIINGTPALYLGDDF